MAVTTGRFVGDPRGFLSPSLHRLFASIYLQGEQALLASWRDRRSAESFKPSPVYDDARIRHRIVRIVRDYGMFDRRESPKYYPDPESASGSR